MDDTLFRLLSKQIETLHTDFQREFEEVKGLQRQTNGRVTKNEKDILLLNEVNRSCPGRRLAEKIDRLNEFKEKEKWKQKTDLAIKIFLLVLSTVLTANLVI